MRQKFCLTLLLLLGGVLSGAVAQSTKNPDLPKAEYIDIRDARNDTLPIPQLGEKVLVIFYVDPDHPSQNKDFTDYLEQNKFQSDNISAYGVVNLAEAPLLPNPIVRTMVRAKIKQTGERIYTDPRRYLSTGWNLGDTNNLFTLIVVDKERNIVFLAKGEMSQDQIDEFFEVMDRYL